MCFFFNVYDCILKIFFYVMCIGFLNELIYLNLPNKEKLTPFFSKFFFLLLKKIMYAEEKNTILLQILTITSFYLKFYYMYML